MLESSEIPLVEVRDLPTCIHTRRGVIRAVDVAGFTMRRYPQSWATGRSSGSRSHSR